ncbi:hypothetical protein, partial [Parabacteroides sp. ZJ-118]|uniref:hypothetical protein n=1 Tax=Parabacteroides sp. ZJ-118 TaxID=2709398 RepID=UPI00198180ED
ANRQATRRRLPGDISAWDRAAKSLESPSRPIGLAPDLNGSPAGSRWETNEESRAQRAHLYVPL